MISPEKIDVRPPKRLDTCMVSKVLYDGTKGLHLQLDFVQITKCKTDGHVRYVTMLVPKHILRVMSVIEARVRQVVAASCDTWFKSKMRADLVDDLFLSNLIVVEGRPHLRLRVEGIDPQIQPGTYNAGIILSHIKFSKLAFHCIFKNFEVTPAACQTFIEDDSSSEGETDHCDSEGLDEDYGPHVQDVLDIRNEAVARIRQEVSLITAALAEKQTVLDRLLRAECLLADEAASKSSDLGALDEVGSYIFGSNRNN